MICTLALAGLVLLEYAIGLLIVRTLLKNSANSNPELSASGPEYLPPNFMEMANDSDNKIIDQIIAAIEKKLGELTNVDSIVININGNISITGRDGKSCWIDGCSYQNYTLTSNDFSALIDKCTNIVELEYYFDEAITGDALEITQLPASIETFIIHSKGRKVSIPNATLSASKKLEKLCLHGNVTIAGNFEDDPLPKSIKIFQIFPNVSNEVNIPSSTLEKLGKLENLSRGNGVTVTGALGKLAES
ncbi:MAG: hypothetical protein LBK24_02115, partial [Puniceicoccales bacterium]|nr:hypothetical protein [Puniceicoccales bacterium]